MDSPDAFAFHKEDVAMRLLQRVERDPLLPARSDILPFILADGALWRRIVRRRILRSAGYADVAHDLWLISGDLSRTKLWFAQLHQSRAPSCGPSCSPSCGKTIRLGYSTY